MSIYELPKPKERKKLTLADLVKKQERIWQEEFPINVPGYDGVVTIRAVKDADEFNQIQKAIETLTELNKSPTGIDMNGKRLSEEKDIWAICYLSACMVEPEVELEDAISMLSGPLGPACQLITNRILMISGLTSGSEQMMEDKLKGDPFSLDAFKHKRGDVAPASKRSKSESNGVA